MLRKIFTNRLFLSTLVLFLITFGCEMYVRVLVEAPLFVFASVRIAISSLAISLLWSYLFHFFRPIIQRIFNIIYVLVVTIGLFTEMCLYSFIGFFMGLGNASQGTKVTSYINDVLHSVPSTYYVMFVFTVIGLVYFIFIERLILKKCGRVKKYTTAQKIFLKTLPVCIVAILFSIHYLVFTE